MIRKRSSRMRVVIGLLAAAMVLVPSGTAFASHFRASNGSFSVTSSGAATWVLKSAWRKGSSDVLFSQTLGDTLEVTKLTSASDDPGTGTGTGVLVALTAYSEDSSNGLFDLSTETITGDVSSLSDGIYELYVNSCCRVGGVSNTAGNSSFSQWVRFTVTSGVFDVAPGFTAAPVYEAIPPTGDLVLNYGATDTTGGVTYSLVTNTADPFDGGEALACSTFSGGVLTLGPSHCTGTDVFADIYTLGTYWAVKVTATDANGNQNVVNTLLRVLVAPEPYIDHVNFSPSGTAADMFAYADDTVVNSWTVTCTGRANSSDVITATSATSPIHLTGLTLGEEYDCTVSATNAAGTGNSSSSYDTGVIAPEDLTLTLSASVGDTWSGTTASFSGTHLAGYSDYSLVQHSTALELYASGTDSNGNFQSSTDIPTEACIAGDHTLTLTALGGDGKARTKTAWYSLDANCVLLTLAFTDPGQLAQTGVTISPVWPGAAFGGMLVGGLLLAFGRRRKAKHSL